MVFAHDTEAALLAAVELANSGLEPDTLTAVEDLDSFFERHSYTGSHRRTRAELDEVRDLRSGLRALFTSSRDDAVARVNTMLAETGAVPQLVRHGGHDWHVHATGAEQPLATRIVVETAMAMIDVIRADEMSRFGVCADADCEGVVLDLSRNRSKRFCSVTCGNRNAVAAYRSRRHGV
ncbi:CGNR zinc finger domain-containing protein [Marmoricola sp. RAF53]|uniref:CGNR zinc finger domain-containing protein n=1 Tax=Marmoricola sp. RAF53 TaxID=3233059 RepID=UPI003F9E50FA